MKKIIKTNNAPQAIGPYNQGIITSQLIFLSGQIPFNSNGKLISDDIKKQTNQCKLLLITMINFLFYIFKLYIFISFCQLITGCDVNIKNLSEYKKQSLRENVVQQTRRLSFKILKGIYHGKEKTGANRTGKTIKREFESYKK